MIILRCVSAEKLAALGRLAILPQIRERYGKCALDAS